MFIKVQLFELHEFWIKVESTDNFDVIKSKILDLFDNIPRYIKSFSKCNISLLLSSSVRKIKYSPVINCLEHVFTRVIREEMSWPGSVSLVILCNNKNMMESYDDDEYLYHPLKPHSCTEFIPTSCQSAEDTTNLPDSMFLDISSISLKQGKLQKYVVSRKQQEQYKEEYFILHKHRLWYFSVKSTNEFEKQLSYIDLNENSTAKIKNVSQCTFEIQFNNNGRGVMILKAKTKDEADNWISDINNRNNISSQPDNYFISAIENAVADTELKHSFKDIEILNHASTFEGMLSNSLLRSHFRKYLNQIMLESSLLFWERAEDYRRGHPYSAQPLSPDKKTMKGQGAGLQTQYVKIWAKGIYNNFLSADCSYRIPYTDTNNLDTEIIGIREKIENILGVPPSSLFENIQKICFDEMKNKLYPEFTKQDNYKVILQTALRHATQSPDVSSGNGIASRATTGHQTPKSHSQTNGNADVAKQRSFFSSLISNGSTTGDSMQQVLDKTARESEASTARKPQTQLEFDWRTQITINEANNYWLTDEWWNLLKTSFPSPASTKYDGTLRKLNNKYIEIWERQQILKEKVSLKYLQSQFRGYVKENYDPVQDELLQTSPSSSSISTQKSTTIGSCIQLSYYTLSTLSSIGFVAMTGLVKCRYIRRQQITTMQAASVATSPLKKTVPSHSKVSSRSRDKNSSECTNDLQNRNRTYTSSAGTTVGSRPAANNLPSNNVDDVGRKRSLSDEFVISEWRCLFFVLSEWLGRGRLLIIDPSTGFVQAIIFLDSVVEINISMLNGFDVRDRFGLNWQLLPEPVDDDDGRYLAQRWLAMLSMYCPSSPSPRVTRILHMGFLSKRGQRNNALQKRWFVISTDKILRYYKEDTQKGEINLNKVATINQNKVTGDYGKSLWSKGSDSSDLRSIVLWTQDRLWMVQADSAEDCTRWFTILKALVNSKLVKDISSLSSQLDLRISESGNDSDDDSND